MKKQVFIMLIASLLLLCACQPTPDEPVVLQKDQELMIQQGTATLEPEEPYTPPEVPNRYRFDFQDGALAIHADATIAVPTAPMPIVKVCAQGIPQDMMYRIFSFLSNGEELHTEPKQTKADIRALIEELMGRMDAGPEYWDDMTQEEYQEGLRRQIEKLEVSYNSAPETDESRVCDGTYETRYIPFAKTECDYINANNQNRSILVFSYKNLGYDSSLHYERYSRFSTLSDEDMTLLDETVLLPDGLKYDDAKAQVQLFLDTLGEPFETAAVYCIGDVKNAEYCALCFDLRRTVNGVPVMMNASDYRYTDESSYSIPWEQEKMRIVVDTKGIASVTWNSPLTITESVSEATSLMSFAKIQGIAEKMIPIVYSLTGSGDNITSHINICSVRLEMIRIREQNNIKELKGLLIPVWNFYGTIEMTENYGKTADGTDKYFRYYTSYGMKSGYSEYRGNEIILCINAIDGTIIDPLLGY